MRLFLGNVLGLSLNFCTVVKIVAKYFEQQEIMAVANTLVQVELVFFLTSVMFLTVTVMICF